VNSSAPALLEVRDLAKRFPVRAAGAKTWLRAVDGVSFHVRRGETVGIVGESGCGKSTLARLLMGLVAHDSGSVLFDGARVGRSIRELRGLRRRMQLVFQDSSASLNPRMSVGMSIAFGPMAHGIDSRRARMQAHELLRRVGLDPDAFADSYPHELSGGQRQRVNIARALALAPELLILDEAVSALDKSVESQILNLLRDLKSSLGLTYLFISHDLHVVRYLCDRVLVMYLGRVVEVGDARAVHDGPRHPYTRALLAALPSGDPDRPRAEAPVEGDPPSAIDPPSGCHFRTRCAHALEGCSRTVPQLRPAAPGGAHWVACLRADELSGRGAPED
jgi:peptide/nickel transport system ATP-binding protein